MFSYQKTLVHCGIALASIFMALIGVDQYISEGISKQAEENKERLVAWQRKINEPVTDMRDYVELGRDRYDGGYIQDPILYNINKKSLSSGVVKSFNGISGITGRDIEVSLTLLDVMNNSVKDLFSKDSLPNNVWAGYEQRTLRLFREKIRKQNKLLELANQTFITRWIAGKRVIKQYKQVKSNLYSEQ